MEPSFSRRCCCPHVRPVYAYRWIGANLDHFSSETLSIPAPVSRGIARPDILILIFVALRPLEKTFIAALTDARFEAARRLKPICRFDNYARLLGVRWDAIAV